MTQQEMVAELARLKAENQALKDKQAAKAKITLKVSEKGGLSVYGLGRFPVTLYKSQWLRLIEAIPTVKSFIEGNAEFLVEKAA